MKAKPEESGKYTAVPLFKISEQSPVDFQYFTPAKQVSWLLNELLGWWFKSDSMCLKWPNIYSASPITKLPLTCLDALVVCQISNLFSCFHSCAAIYLHKRGLKIFFCLSYVMAVTICKIKCSPISTITEAERVVRCGLWEHLSTVCDTGSKFISALSSVWGG